jgi:glycosyltransferase involved in cell wall biosynthesis
MSHRRLGRRSKRPPRDIAIYSPAATVFYGGLGPAPPGAQGIPRGGGAELQMALLARGLTEHGLRVGLIIWPHGPERSLPGPEPTLIERAAYVGDRRRTGPLAEALHIWRALAAADASAYLFRGSSPRLLAASVFCLRRRRKLIFSAANDLDFDFERPDRSRGQLALYRAALRRVDLIVAQRQEQLELARRAGFGPVELIPSFAEPAEPTRAEPDAFLWVGRLVDYKRPMEYLRLAKSLPEIAFRMIWLPTSETRPELIEEVKSAAARLPNLELLGQTPRTQVLELIERAPAVVMTSAAEGMPNVLLEAWSRAVPAISLDYDPDGKIESERLGLVAGGSEARLREAVSRLWADERLRAELGERGREYVRAVHWPEAVSRRWAEVVRGVL